MENKQLYDEIEEIRLLTHYTNRNKKKIKKRKKIGAPKGHIGYARSIPKKIDSIKEVILENCPICSDRITGKVIGVRSRHITNIKPILKSRTTQYNIPRKYCTKCKKIVEPILANALPHSLLGINLMYIVVYLRLGLSLSWGKINDYIKHIYNVKMTNAALITFLKRIAHHNEEVYNQILLKLIKRKVIYADETRWPIHGVKWWVWIFSSESECVYILSDKRDHKVPCSLLNDYKGILVCDFYSAYEKVKCKQQKCLVHVLRDFQRALKKAPYDEELKIFIEDFLKIFEPIFKKLREPDTDYTQIKTKKKIVKKRIKELLKKEYISKEVNKFKKRFTKHLESMIRFLNNPEKISWNNNQAERDLRPLCIQRKISGSLQSEKVSNDYLLLFSIYQTCEKRQINFLKFLQSKRNNIPKRVSIKLKK